MCQNETGLWRRRIGFAFVGGSLMLSSCSTVSYPLRLEGWLPADEAWQMSDVAAGAFTLATLHKKRAAEMHQAGVVHIYIEGDGRAYLSAGEVSGNPTPKNPVALKLALADAAPIVVYLARPCQFVDVGARAECRDRKLYTDGRWSEEVVRGYVEVVKGLIPTGHKVELVGYSGGGYIALAVAGRLQEGQVARVVTVAGNLLPNAVHKSHGIEALPDVAELNWDVLTEIEQVHYIGKEDRVIPAELRSAYVSAAGQAGLEAVASGRWRWVDVEATHGERWDAIPLHRR